MKILCFISIIFLNHLEISNHKEFYIIEVQQTYDRMPEYHNSDVFIIDVNNFKNLYKKKTKNISVLFEKKGGFLLSDFAFDEEYFADCCQNHNKIQYIGIRYDKQDSLIIYQEKLNKLKEVLNFDKLREVFNFGKNTFQISKRINYKFSVMKIYGSYCVCNFLSGGWQRKYAYINEAIEVKNISNLELINIEDIIINEKWVR
ncbi:MAG: hypothetical protein EAZ08_00700 [Cytophagales bacterium]|nr:MAG: hypothetical protein EAZ08_00700 [Cytophagales bacterium]